MQGIGMPRRYLAFLYPRTAPSSSIAKEFRRGPNTQLTTMEGNYLTSGDLAMWDTARTGRRGYYDDGYCGTHRGGMSATGIGLAAGLGGGALLLAAAGIWGANQASKARAKAAENAAAGNAKAIDILANHNLAERQSRETWQNMHAPSMTQYVDVRTGAGASALSQAEALAAILNGNNRGGQVCPQPVALYQPAMPCRCNTCGD